MNSYCVFRVDASSDIGIGHLMRCITLGKQLSKYGFSIAFICNENTSIYKEIIMSSGSCCYFIVDDLTKSNLPSEAYDSQETLKICHKLEVFAVFVDHYKLGVTWEKSVRMHNSNLIVIDDLANREHDCKFLLDSTYNRLNSDYKNKVSDDTKLLTGSKFCLLREEFYLLRKKSIKKRSKTKKIKSLLLNFGGVDPMKHTLLSYKLVREINRDIKISIIISKACVHLDEVLIIKDNDRNVNVYIDTDKVADLMFNTDLSIGAMGTSTWERSCLGLPCIALISAENQRHNANLLEEKGAIILSDENNLKTDIKRLIEPKDDMKLWQDIVSNSIDVCDGRGVYRVSREIIKSTFSLEKFKAEDSQNLYSWQSESTARIFSRNSTIPSKSDHEIWVMSSLQDANRRMWILKVNDESAGYVRLDDIGNLEEVSILISEGFRDIGLASFAINEAKSKSKYKSILAFVDSENVGSIKLFSRCDYKKIKENNYLWEEKRANN